VCEVVGGCTHLFGSGYASGMQILIVIQESQIFVLDEFFGGSYRSDLKAVALRLGRNMESTEEALGQGLGILKHMKRIGIGSESSFWI